MNEFSHIQNFYRLLHLCFRTSLISINNCPTRCNTKQSIYYSACRLIDRLLCVASHWTIINILQTYTYRFVGWLDSAVPIEDAFCGLCNKYGAQGTCVWLRVILVDFLK